jgi:2-polyprenyl-3-methyl-5-hydroxy-6-metoxy-1,4-benzoquinol methylase
MRAATIPLESRQVDAQAVESYDPIAPAFAGVALARRAYLDRIDELVISGIPSGARSLLDVGAGDGSRALRIAGARKLSDVVLLEPSAAMRAHWRSDIRGWPIRAEELGSKTGQFDAIVCLWNVLGHIFPSSARIDVLRHCARLLAPEGRLFLDVSHRYNARHYGLLPTLTRMIGDRLFPSDDRGDVTVHWNVNSHAYATRGHVFADAEFRRMASAAGLEIRKVFSVDYATGEIRRSRFSGHLLYIASRRAARSAEHSSSISSGAS